MTRGLGFGRLDAERVKALGSLRRAKRARDPPALRLQPPRQGFGAVAEAEDEEAGRGQSRALIASRAASAKSGRARA